MLWAPGHPANLEAQVRKALGEIDPNLVLYSVDPYQHLLDTSFAQQNMIATLTMLFGGLALVLAAVGLYGVTAYTVEQRTSEIGVRMALGADRGRVVKMVLRGAFWQVGVGLLMGIPAAIGAGKLIADQLYGVKAWDPMMLGGATLLLGAGRPGGGDHSGAAGGESGSGGGVESGVRPSQSEQKARYEKHLAKSVWQAALADGSAKGPLLQLFG